MAWPFRISGNIRLAFVDVCLLLDQLQGFLPPQLQGFLPRKTLSSPPWKQRDPAEIDWGSVIWLEHQISLLIDLKTAVTKARMQADHVPNMTNLQEMGHVFTVHLYCFMESTPRVLEFLKGIASNLIAMASNQPGNDSKLAGPCYTVYFAM